VIITKKVETEHSERRLDAAILAATTTRMGSVNFALSLRMGSILRHPHPSPISNRELTMRRALASRAGSATRGICFALSNGELDLLERNVDRCKQTKPTRCNRKLSICNPSIPGKKTLQNSKNLANICKWSRPLLTASDPQTEIAVTPRKQSLEKILTGARIAFSHPTAPPLKSTQKRTNAPTENKF
jgi:hypothetical protein